MIGKFVVLEGIEGSGKTRSIPVISDILKKNGISNIIFTHEPGGTPLLNKLRDLIKYEVYKENLLPYSELLILYAARVQLVKTIIQPALLKNTWVIGDRHDLSTQAYQGGGRRINKKFISYLKKTLLGNFSPDLTLYLDISPEIGLSRIRSNRNLDRIELESLEFFNRTRSRYKELANKYNDIITIDASQSIDIVNINIKYEIEKWLKYNLKK